MVTNWTDHLDRAMIEDAAHLAFIGAETIEAAAARLDRVNSADHLEHMLYSAGRGDIVHQFTRNADRSRPVFQGVIH